MAGRMALGSYKLAVKKWCPWRDSEKNGAPFFCLTSRYIKDISLICNRYVNDILNLRKDAMTRNQKPVMLDPKTHKRLKKASKDSGQPMGEIIASLFQGDTMSKLIQMALENGTSPGEIMTGLVNMAERRAEHAIKSGVIPDRPKNLNPMNKGKRISYRTAFRINVALFLKETGEISNKNFQNIRNSVDSYFFANGFENIEPAKLSFPYPGDR
jgi:hypothetical protein